MIELGFLEKQAQAPYGFDLMSNLAVPAAAWKGRMSCAMRSIPARTEVVLPEWIRDIGTDRLLSNM